MKTSIMLRIVSTVSATALLVVGCSGVPQPAPSAAPEPSLSSPAGVGTPAETPATSTPTLVPTTAPPTESVPAPAVSEHNQRALVAIETAQAATGGTAHELDWDHNRWEVNLIAGSLEHDVDLNAAGTTIVRKESERADAEDRNRIKRAKVTMADAITAALATVPGAKVVEVDLDTRSGELVWEVDTISNNTRQRILVDAITGAVS